MPDGRGLDAAGLQGAQGRKTAKQVKAALAAGRLSRPRPTRRDRTFRDRLAVLMVFVVAATALYGPQAAALVEMFPTRVRYTAMSPALSCRHRLGRRLPARHQLRHRRDDRRYLRGLWYAVVFTAISASCRLLFLKETAARSRSRRSAFARRLDRAARDAESRRTSGYRSAARPRPAPGRSAASTTGRRRSRLRACSRLSSPVMVISTVRADRIAARVSVTRATGASCRHRVGHHADRAAGPGRVERGLKVGAGEDRRGVPVVAHAEPDQIGRPGQVLEPGVGRIAGHLVVRDLAGDRHDPRPGRQEGLGDPADVASRHCPRTSRSSVGMIVTRFHGSFGLPASRRSLGRVPAGESDQRRPARSTALSMMKPMSPATASASLLERFIVPPFGFDHRLGFFRLARGHADSGTSRNPLPVFD